MRAPLGRAVLTLFLLLAPFSGARGDYRSSYETGIKAMDQKDWPAAVRAFQAALREKPGEGGQVLIYGMRYRAYLPHYYLGVAYSNLGNCEAALAEWKESESQGAIRSAGEYRELGRYRGQCEAQAGGPKPKPAAAATPHPAVAESIPPTPGPRPVLPTSTSVPRIVQKLEPTPTSVPRIVQKLEPTAAVPAAPRPTLGPSPEVARARAAAEGQLKSAETAAAELAVSRDQPNARPLWQSDPGLRRKEDGARKALDAARTLLAGAKQRGDVAGFVRATQMALDANRQFSTLSKSLTSRIEQARVEREKQERVAAAKELEARRSEARTLLGQLPKTSASESMRQTREELQAALARFEGSPADRSLEDLRKSSETIVRLTSSLRMLARPTPPPAELLAGAEAYFGGDYEKAAQILEAKTFGDPRAAAQARLFVAASRYSSWVLGGSVDGKLREQAAAAARECAHLNASLALNPRAFSPRFVEFFQKERGDAGAQTSSINR
jgi:tetratricopeptide (TPR) repeat protein